jgi:aryl-alcohol dehydrogenase-like predicted oxidoreductase
MIKQRLLGRTGLKISELCLGTLNFGWKTDEKTAFAILDAYHAAGGNFIQATNHGPEIALPSVAATFSEEIVGRWWKARGLRREDLFFATRIYVRQPPAGGVAAFTAIVREACQDSLRRLQTDWLDLVIFEWSEGLVPIAVSLEAFDVAVRGGMARYLGAAGFPVWRVVDSLGRAYLRSHCRFEALQADYSLITRARFEPEAMALCQEQRLSFFARSPLADGFLAGRGGFGPGLPPARREWLVGRFGNSYGAAARSVVADVAARHGVSPARVALAWVLHNPAVTAAVVGVQSVAQLDDLVQAAALPLSAADLVRLDHATAAEEIRLGSAIARAPVPEEELVVA